MKSVALSILDVHPYLRPPMWRSMVARDVANDKGLVDIVRTRDAWISAAITDEEARRENRSRAAGRKGAAVANARAIHDSARPGGWRWYVEALLCAGLSDAAIAELLEFPFKKAAVEAFRRIYFDVDCYRSASGELSKTALEANVMSSSRSRIINPDSHDYAWKRIAIRFGAKGFLDFTKGVYSADQRDFVTILAANRNLGTALAFSENPVRVAKELGSDIALAFMKLPQDIQAAREKSRMQDGALSEELDGYFDIMGSLVLAAQRVVTTPKLVSGVVVENGRGIQRITSGNLISSVKALPANAGGEQDGH